MKDVIRITKTTWFCSEVRLDVETTDPELGETIAWADEHPVAYEIITTGRSKAFGTGSNDYLGGRRHDLTSIMILERLHVLRGFLEGWHAVNSPERPGEDMQTWRANFTLARFKDPGFTGGVFQQHARWTDGKEYPRYSMVLDYTPETLEEVLDRFVAWTNQSYRYENTTRITVDGADRRVFLALETPKVRSPKEARRGT